jgi:RNA-directed DNA polymerase
VRLLFSWRSGHTATFPLVTKMWRDLMSNILLLHGELTAKTYKHSTYEFFKVNDPKPRDIHKAKVRDRLLHHALYRKLYPFFDRTFISDSTSCRFGKGTHVAIDRFSTFGYKVSQNHTKTAWVLKCDIRKFFASIDQTVLLEILSSYIPDRDILDLISKIVGSFHSTAVGVGLPLGNLTSQILVNIYMNKFDHFMKHCIKAEYYIRYADDFVVMNTDREWLLDIVSKIQRFLSDELALQLHPKKLDITTISSGIDFLGWVHFPDHRVLRTATKKRMLRNIECCDGNEAVIDSYIGLLSHGNAWELSRLVESARSETTYSSFLFSTL